MAAPNESGSATGPPLPRSVSPWSRVGAFSGAKKSCAARWPAASSPSRTTASPSVPGGWSPGPTGGEMPLPVETRIRGRPAASTPSPTTPPPDCHTPARRLERCAEVPGPADGARASVDAIGGGLLGDGDHGVTDDERLGVDAAVERGAELPPEVARRDLRGRQVGFRGVPAGAGRVHPPVTSSALAGAAERPPSGTSAARVRVAARVRRRERATPSGRTSAASPDQRSWPSPRCSLHARTSRPGAARSPPEADAARPEPSWPRNVARSRANPAAPASSSTQGYCSGAGCRRLGRGQARVACRARSGSQTAIDMIARASGTWTAAAARDLSSETRPPR